MEAVILSGGFGTRLRPLTLTRPKPLLPIVNSPMVEHILDALPDEVDHAVLAAGYKVEQLERWAKDLDHRVSVTVVNEAEPLGTAGAIANVADHLTGEFLCFNGDVLSSAPLADMIAARRKADALGALALWPVEDPSHFGVVALDGDRITRFVEKPDPGQAPTNLINAGTYCFAHDILGHIERGRKVSLEREVYPAVLDAGHTLLGLAFDGYWVDCGRPEVYLEAHRILLGDRLELGEDARFDGVREGFVCLGRGARVEDGAYVARSVLLDGAFVGAGARVTGSVLGERAQVGREARVEGTVIGDGAKVPERVTIKDERITGD